jgi:hypothetical protein
MDGWMDGGVGGWAREWVGRRIAWKEAALPGETRRTHMRMNADPAEWGEPDPDGEELAFEGLGMRLRRRCQAMGNNG